MIPQGSTLPNAHVIERQQPSTTWGLDFTRGRVIGMVDGLEAVRQTVYCILHSERFTYLIYSFNYGSELSRLVGRSQLFVESEIKRRIGEALLQDDRITATENYQFEIGQDQMLVRFTVITDMGRFDEEVEVSV